MLDSILLGKGQKGHDILFEYTYPTDIPAMILPAINIPTLVPIV